MKESIRYNLIQKKQIPSLIALLFFSTPLFANEIKTDFPLPPRLYLGIAYGTTTFGEGDLLAPIWGNNNQIFHGDINLKYGDDKAWLASLGLGIRKVLGCDMILGGYLFVDYNRTAENSSFTVLNPGIEFIMTGWDGHINGYFPISRDKEVLNTFTGTQLGIPNSVFLRGQTPYDTVFDYMENIGPGADVEFGYTFNPFSFLDQVRAFLGGYYFAPQYASHIRGIEAGFEISLSHLLTMDIRDSYDNVNKNTFLLTFRVLLGGIEKCAYSEIHDLILERIPRHLGSLSDGDGIPSQKRLIAAGKKLF